MDSGNSVKTCLDVYNLIPENYIKKSEKFNAVDEEYYFALECILNVEIGMGNQLVDEKKFKSLSQKIKNSTFHKDPIEEEPFLPSADDMHYFEINKSESSSESAESSEDESELPPMLRELSDELREDADRAVQHFLFPYISNQITPEQDEKRIIPFLTVLSDELCDKHKMNRLDEKFQSLVLYYYIKYAVRGLYTNWHLEGYHHIAGQKSHVEFPEAFKVHYFDLTPLEKLELLQDQEYLELHKRYKKWAKSEDMIAFSFEYTKPTLILFNALFPALKKDFPNVLKMNEMIQLTLEMLEIIEKERDSNFRQRIKEDFATGRRAALLPEGAIPKKKLYLCLKQRYASKDTP